MEADLADAASRRASGRVEVGSGAAAEPQTVVEEGARSSYGTVPGDELPAAVYVSVFGAFLWIVAASLLAFAHTADADFALGMAVTLAIVFFALPVLVWLTARAHVRHTAKDGDFLASPVETATGSLPGGSVWVQIVLIPASLALAATLIGAASLVVH